MTSTTLDTALTAEATLTAQHLINGQWLGEGVTRRMNPARPDELAALSPSGSAEDVDVDTLRRRAERLCARLGWPPGCVRESVATVGGGSLPGRELASIALVANVDSAHQAAASLRRARPAMIARVRADELWIDLRTLVDVDDEIVLASLRQL